MRRASIASPDFTYDDTDPDGFRSGMFRLGGLLGAERTGMTVYELPGGEAVCPYHYEYGEEEWLLVVEGTATVRTPDGTQELGPWEVTCFPRGPEGAHQVRNDGEATARVVMWSEVVVPTATAYPDSDKLGVWTGNKADDRMFRRSSAVEYFDGESAP